MKHEYLKLELTPRYIVPTYIYVGSKHPQLHIPVHIFCLSLVSCHWMSLYEAPEAGLPDFSWHTQNEKNIPNYNKVHIPNGHKAYKI
jgi:hypothetical protein